MTNKMYKMYFGCRINISENNIPLTCYKFF